MGGCVVVAGVMLALTQYQSEIRIRACNDLIFDQYPVYRLDREPASQGMGYLMQMVFYFNSVDGRGFFPDQFVYEIGFTKWRLRHSGFVVFGTFMVILHKHQNVYS